MGTLSPYRNWFYGLTVVLLAMSFYLVYKNGKTVNKVILWVATVVVLGMLLYTNRFLLTNLLT